MGFLINDNLIWVSIPKCGSTSISDGLLASDLDIKKHINYSIYPNKHLHVPLIQLYDYFGKHETVCIRRDWFERWLSALEMVWLSITNRKYKPIIEWENIDNDFLYKTFDSDFLNNLHTDENREICNYSIIKDYKPVTNDTIRNLSGILASQKFWTNNEKCTYEFNLDELNKFSEFLNKRYNRNIEFPHINPIDSLREFTNHTNVKSKIVFDNQLKNWVWESFEKRYQKGINLI